MSTLFNSGNPDLSALWLRNPEAAVLECRIALLSEGTVKAAAKKLGIGRSTLHRYIKKHP